MSVTMATNGAAKAEVKEELMEVADENGELEGEDKSVKEAINKTAGTFKLKVSGLPKFYSLGEFKKVVKDDLGLALTYIRSPKKGNPWLHLTFSTHEEQQKALGALDQYSWRKQTLSCNELQGLDSNGKRKPDEHEDDGDAKKAKLDLSVEERVLMVTIPLHAVPYEEQLKTKMTELRGLVGRLGDLLVRRNPMLSGWAEQQKTKCDGLVFKLDEILPSPVIDAYRNKCELRAGINPETLERTVGCRLDYFKEGKVGVGPADSFKHLPEQIRNAVKIFQDYIRASDKGPFIVEKSEGYWRHLVVRCTSNGDVMIVVVAHPQALTPEEIQALKDDLKDFYLNREGKVCNVASLYFQLFTEKLVGRPLPEMEQLFGKTHLQEQILGVTFHLTPTSYFQVNTRGAEVLYNSIIKMIEPTQETTILDLCCGTGGIGLCLAKLCGKVFGIEYLEQNIEDAKYNADKNGITNCEFIAGRVEDVLPTLEEKLAGQNVIPILDPPRTGLNQKVLCQLRKMSNVRKMIYVCSNHKAPIRNFLMLCCPEGKGNMEGHPFVPTLVVPVDMAPHTMHAQMVVLLEPVDPATLPKPSPTVAVRPRLRRGAPVFLGRGRGMFPPRGRGLPAPLLMPLRGGFMRGRGVMRRPMPLLRRPAPLMRPMYPLRPPLRSAPMRSAPMRPANMRPAHMRPAHMRPAHMGPAPLLRSAPPMRPLPLLRNRERGYDGDFGPTPLLGRRREYLPEYPPRAPEFASRLPGYASRAPQYAPPRIPEYSRVPEYSPRVQEYAARLPDYSSREPQRQRLDFSSDELTLSRYSDFRRDVEDAIDSSYNPPYRRLSLQSPAMAMLEREEMAYQAGLTRGLVSNSMQGPRSLFSSPYSAGAGGRGIKRGPGGGRPVRRGLGGRR